MTEAIERIMLQIFREIGIRIIPANQTTPKPPLPYGVYNITSAYIKDRNRGNISTYQDGEVAYEKRTEPFKMTISFNFYNETNETTIELAMQVRRWFLFLGSDFIQEQNIAVVNVGNIENRTTFLFDSYEYKHGFDVQLRLTDEQIRAIETIEKVNIGGM
ncbi:hypothetical protein C0966_00735 [Bacillus methanolicus]|uniref:phage neck terminator protein n=1 Tax=Bacillus methanolicus TaxID=1471 RepID=UPI002380B3DC|nr:hypothetical protein [Bacillus methanolicus]MDE3837934.1 hypothetical protein [Bacillus methanolicus]